MSGTIVMFHGTRHVLWQCSTCGVWATCPEVVYEERYKEGGYNFCPNGHQWGWSKTTCEREVLRRERDLLKQRLAQKDDTIAAEARAHAATKAKVKRMEKRSAAGACPCCKRTFSNMSVHMKKQHPDFVEGTMLKLVRSK